MRDKIVIVTGASSGLGRAAAAVFAKAGSTVCAVGRNENELAALRDEHADAGGTIRVQLADVTEASQVDRMVSEIVEAFGHIDVLDKSAGDIRDPQRSGSDLCLLTFARDLAKKINRLERAFAVLAEEIV